MFLSWSQTEPLAMFSKVECVSRIRVRLRFLYLLLQNEGGEAMNKPRVRIQNT